ncbi:MULTISPECIES: hypothetical protein [unclassified Mesorhizobium]|uniref:hypothetical protein n=1 Tax=unclassified Mesorhizobium TaxID=325217 RepID=UPI00112D4BDB|nr:MULTISPECIES: hypothetical protein [unclassified Mesorhizobium]TPJ70500.1 hypothetical protein FJ462_07345 [Mesorhizobium sp. B2-6-7]TPJ76843.1 hypothetical protein FJ422_29475 [Mesorhizobium sp. B2-6-3]
MGELPRNVIEVLGAAKRALEYSINSLDGVIALDDEDWGENGGSAACQATIKINRRALSKINALLDPRPSQSGDGNG